MTATDNTYKTLSLACTVWQCFVCFAPRLRFRLVWFVTYPFLLIPCLLTKLFKAACRWHRSGQRWTWTTQTGPRRYLTNCLGSRILKNKVLLNDYHIEVPNHTSVSEFCSLWRNGLAWNLKAETSDDNKKPWVIFLMSYQILRICIKMYGNK